MIGVRIRLYYTSKAVVRLFTGSIYTLSLGCRVTLMGFVRVWYRHQKENGRKVPVLCRSDSGYSRVLLPFEGIKKHVARPLSPSIA